MNMPDVDRHVRSINGERSSEPRIKGLSGFLSYWVGMNGFRDEMWERGERKAG